MTIFIRVRAASSSSLIRVGAWVSSVDGIAPGADMVLTAGAGKFIKAMTVGLAESGRVAH